MRKNKSLSIKRITTDIKHLNLNKLNDIKDNSKNWLGCGKHLCGAATDYTLRSCLLSSKCCINYIYSLILKINKNLILIVNNYLVAEEVVPNIAITTCCHHSCIWKAYVGKEFFLKNNISKEEFEVISWMTGNLVNANASYLLK